MKPAELLRLALKHLGDGSINSRLQQILGYTAPTTVAVYGG